MSAPDSLHLQVGATSDSVAYLTEIFAGPIATLDCAFDARFAAPPSAPLLSVSVGYDDVGLGLGATSSLGSCYYPPPDAAAGCNGGATVPTPSPGVWKHVTFELDVGSGTFVLDYDGAAVGSASLVGALPNDSASVTLTLGFNVPYNAVGPLDVYIDNFYCDVSP